MPIPEWIRNAIDIQVGRAIDEEIERAAERIKGRRGELYTAAILQVEKYLSAERIGEALRIEIKLTDK